MVQPIRQNLIRKNSLILMYKLNENIYVFNNYNYSYKN